MDLTTKARDILMVKLAALELYIVEQSRQQAVDSIVISIDPTKHTASDHPRLGNSLFDVGDDVLDYITDNLHEIAERLKLPVVESVFTQRGQIGDFKKMVKMPEFGNSVFVFNDNVREVGTGGTAAIRQKQDVLRFGIPTGWEPGARRMGFVSLDDTANRVKQMKPRKKRSHFSELNFTSSV